MLRRRCSFFAHHARGDVPIDVAKDMATMQTNNQSCLHFLPTFFWFPLLSSSWLSDKQKQFKRWKMTLRVRPQGEKFWIFPFSTMSSPSSAVTVEGSPVRQSDSSIQSLAALMFSSFKQYKHEVPYPYTTNIRDVSMIYSRAWKDAHGWQLSDMSRADEKVRWVTDASCQKFSLYFFLWFVAVWEVVSFGVFFSHLRFSLQVRKDKNNARQSDSKTIRNAILIGIGETS